jgi:hypothetical protein
VLLPGVLPPLQCGATAILLCLLHEKDDLSYITGADFCALVLERASPRSSAVMLLMPGRYSIAAAVDTQDTLSPGILCSVCAMLPAVRPMIWLQDDIPADEALPRCCDLCWLRAEHSTEAHCWKSRRRNRSAAAVCFSCSASARSAESGTCSC